MGSYIDASMDILFSNVAPVSELILSSMALAITETIQAFRVGNGRTYKVMKKIASASNKISLMYV